MCLRNSVHINIGPKYSELLACMIYTKGRKVFVCDFSKAKLIYKIKRFLRYFLSA